MESNGFTGVLGRRIFVGVLWRLGVVNALSWAFGGIVGMMLRFVVFTVCDAHGLSQANCMVAATGVAFFAGASIWLFLLWYMLDGLLSADLGGVGLRVVSVTREGSAR